MENILIGVVGCSGFIGKKVCERLVKKYNVRGGCRRKENNCMVNNRFSLRTVDVYDIKSLDEFCRGCSMVINCAGPTYKIGERVAVAAKKVGADYIDIFGSSMLKSAKMYDKENTYRIFSAGSMPGFSGILPKWLIEKFTTIKNVRIYEGSFEKSGICACEDIILSAVNGFGLKDTFVENGEYIHDGLPSEQTIVPGVPEPVYCQYYFTKEMQHLQTKYGISDLKVYHMSVNSEVDKILSKACLEAVILDDTNVHNAAHEIYSHLEKATKNKETWYAYIIEFQVENCNKAMQKRLIVRAAESTQINAVVIEGVVEEIVHRKKEPGTYWSFEFVDTNRIMKVLSDEKIIKYQLTDVPIYSELTIKYMEEGEL